MRTALFIDFDGVFHPEGSCSYLEEEARYSFVDEFRWLKQFLETIRDFPTLEVVIHSSWRSQWRWEEMSKVVPEALLERCSGVTSPEIASRYASILDHVADHQISPDRYVILDDDARAFPDPHPPQLILVDPRFGLGDPEVCAQLYRALKRIHV
jgi:hypothetical protein